jgi:Mn2+/Fe2+ NRAMP family transporter
MTAPNSTVSAQPGRRRWTARVLAVLGVYTGEGVGGLIREQFSPRATFVAMTLLLVANAA